jgi:two-component system sensor histidine kinase BarA
MDAVLHKPFSVKKLAECIGAFLAPTAAEEAAEVHEPWEGKRALQPQDEAALLDSETIERLLQTAQSGRRDFIDRILTLYQSHAPRVLSDLRDAAERRDDIGVAASAHSLKSMSLNMGVGDLAARLAGIEAAARNSREVPGRSELDSLRALLEATIHELLGAFATSEPARLSA